MAIAVKPDLVVFFGFRAVFSLAGLAAVLIGFWISEKKWDEDGSAAYQKAVENVAGDDYQVVDEETQTPAQNPSGSTPVNVPTPPRGDVVVPREDLMAAAPHPKIMLAGFATWAFSMFYLPYERHKMYIEGWNASAVILMLIIAILLAFPIRRANIERNQGLKTRTSMIIIALFIGVMLVTMFDDEIDAPWYTNLFAGIFFFLAYQGIRRSRKMGITWDEEGHPNNEIATQNHGFILLFFAIFLFWIGTNAVYTDSVLVGGFMYIPLYSSIRTWITFLAGPFIILQAQLFMDRAFDAGSAVKDKYCLDGTTLPSLFTCPCTLNLDAVGVFLETPALYVAGWALLGIAQFMPTSGGLTIGEGLAFSFCILTGCVYGLKVLPCYWKGYYDQHRKWNGVYFASMCLLGLSVGVHSWNACFCAVLGVVGILAGQHMDMFERKRGFFWLYDRKVNPAPTVYGIGQPLHMTGWIFLCLAMSIPY